MEMKLSECAHLVHGTLVGEDVSFAAVNIDTRTITAEQLYIAIKGKNFDGNEFVDQAQQAGGYLIDCKSDWVMASPAWMFLSCRLGNRPVASFLPSSTPH